MSDNPSSKDHLLPEYMIWCCIFLLFIFCRGDFLHLMIIHREYLNCFKIWEAVFATTHDPRFLWKILTSSDGSFDIIILLEESTPKHFDFTFLYSDYNFNILDWSNLLFVSAPSSVVVAVIPNCFFTKGTFRRAYRAHHWAEEFCVVEVLSTSFPDLHSDQPV